MTGDGQAPALAVDEHGRLPLPWLDAAVGHALAARQGHAVLLHASPGAGALAFGIVVAQSSLCERPASGGLACGACGSCRLVSARVHPDLAVVLPESVRREQGWPAAGDRQDSDEAKRKASRQIRVEQLRSLAEWAGRTASRGRGKVALIQPAEAMNQVAASALLKTLEEPPPGTRLLLACADPSRLLATVRSRCQRVPLPNPGRAQALGWLQGQGVDDAGVLLAGCAGQPLAALALARDGVDAASWSALPAAVAEERSDAFANWPVARLLDALHKLCHDALTTRMGGAPVFYPAARVPAAADPARLLAWSRELQRVARHADHPWQEALLVAALVADGARALRPDTRGGGDRRRRTAATLAR